MTENQDENLLNPEKPLTLDIAQRFMAKYADYYALKRDLTPKGNLIQQTKNLTPQQILSSRE